MSSISSINQAISITAYKGDELSTTIKMRLEALGIDPSSVTSESQAQILIAQAEAARNQNNSRQQQGGNSSQQQLISEAKALAQKVGTNVSSQDSLIDIIDNISETLQTMGKDPAKAKLVGQYQSELTELAQKADVTINTQQNIFNTMDMISVSNKLILGL